MWTRRCWLPVVLLFVVGVQLHAKPPFFQRGDKDGSGSLDISDPIAILNILFLGAVDSCVDASDFNDDGQRNIADPVYLLNYLFSGGPPPPTPLGECGFDPTEDLLDCESHPACDESERDRVFGSFGILDTIAGKGEVSIGGVSGWSEKFEGGPATAAELSRPHNALGDLAGNIYIADKDAHGIRKVTPDGNIVTVAGTNVAGDDGDTPGPGVERRRNEPNGIWVLGDGTVYILDTGNDKVRKLATDGTLSTLFAVPGLRTGRGLWVAHDESEAFVCSRTALLRWTPAGGVATYAIGFQHLGNLVVLSSGEVIVTDRNAHRVYRVHKDGTREAIAGNGLTTGGGDGQPALETGLNEVRGIWQAETGGFFLGTQAGSQVWYLATDGIIHLFLDGRSDNQRAGDGEPFDTPGPKVSRLRNVTMDRAGNLL